MVDDLGIQFVGGSLDASLEDVGVVVDGVATGVGWEGDLKRH